MTTAKRVALYLRVSTSDQTCKNQKSELSAWARAAGHKVACVFEGSQEPRGATSGQASTPCSRLRSNASSISSPCGRLTASAARCRALYQMLGVFSELEREMIVARVNAGIARGRQQGTPIGRPKVGDAKERAIRAELRLPAHPRDAGCRRLAGQRQTRPSHLAAGRAESTRQTTQTGPSVAQ